MIKELLKILLGNSAAKHIQAGDNYYSKGKYQEAQDEYKKALELEPENNEVREKMRLMLREKETLKIVKGLDRDQLLMQIPAGEEKEEEEEEEEVCFAPEEGKDRRKFIRIYEERAVQFRLLKNVGAKEESSDVLSEDVSAGGIQIISSEKLTLGSFIELKFSFPSPPSPVFAIGKIVRREEIRKNDQIKYSLGVKFTNISEKDRERINEYARKYEEKKSSF